MTESQGGSGWFLGPRSEPDSDPDSDPDDDRRSGYAVVIGSVGAIVVAAAMALAIVFAFGNDDTTAVVPQVGGGTSGPTSASPPAASPSATTTTAEASPTPTTTPTPTAATPTPNPQPVDFVSPSGNIACTVAADRAECHIGSYDYEAPAAGECPATWGDMLAVTANGSDWVCHHVEPVAGTEVLGYGDDVTVGDLTCASAENGVTCRHDPSGASFRISRDSFDMSGARPR